MRKNKERKKLLFKFYQDNKGSAMAMTIVIIAFISVLAAVLMFASYLGYQMRLMDKQGKDVFYSAETVLDEINVGLQAEVSDAMAVAYEDIMLNYALYDSAEKRSSRFNETYINELKKAIQGTAEEGCYDVVKLRTYLSKDIIGNSTGTVEDGDGGSREKFGTHGAIVESFMESNLSSDKGVLYMQTAENLLLKDLRVSYVDERGNVSMLTTDIRIILPDISFAQPSELPALEDACLIADVMLTLDNGTATIQGNAYAGEMTIGKADKINGNVTSVISNGQMQFENKPGSDPGSMSLVVSTKDVTVNGGSTLKTNDVEFWGQNILLKSSLTTGNSSTVDLSGNTNVYDDIVLEGAGSRLSLVGEYNGFGMNLTSNTGGTADDRTNPAFSSAIVVNGKDSRLDFSGLQNMTIAGHTYVQTKVPSLADGTGDIPGVTSPDQYANKANVLMGESVALKSNQLIYLVPGEALGCKYEESLDEAGNVIKRIGDSAYGVNPLTLEQYEEIINNPDDYVLLDGDREIAALGSQPLSNYINKENIQGQTENQYMPEVIFNRTNSSTLVYCYLRFPNEEKANKYFEAYYNINSAQISQYTHLYAKEIKMDTDAMTYLNLAGNMLVYTEGQAEAELIAAPGDRKTSLTAKQNQAKNIFNTKSNNFKALSAKMVKDVARLSGAEQGRTAFVNIIDEDKVRALIDATPGSDTLDVVHTDPDGTIRHIVLTKKANYTLEGGAPDSGIIISLGNVDVKKDFDGLILAKENITLTPGAAGVTISALGVDEFSALFDEKIPDTDTYVLDVFRGGINYKASFEGGAGTGSGTATEKVVSGDLIRYERWTKR